MIYCNPYPIASGCQVSVDVVKDALNNIWKAVADLIQIGKDLDLNFGFARVGINDRSLKVAFKEGLTCTV